MRNAFFKALEKLFMDDDRVYFMTGDLGYKLFGALTAHDSRRVINTGIREAAMAGMAAGLAKEGMLPFIYSITPFVTLRCIEQIKIDICYHNFKVIVVGVGGGFAYGENGPTHHGVEDIGLMRLLPGMTVFAPCDPTEVEACVGAVPGLKGPAYLRLGRNGEPRLFDDYTEPDIFSAQILADGEDATIVVTGSVTAAALDAARALKEEKISARVVKVACLKPLDEKGLLNSILPGRPVLSVEEHIGGNALALLLADILARNGAGNRFGSAYIPDEFPHMCMSQKKLLEWAGLDAASIARKCAGLVRG